MSRSDVRPARGPTQSLNVGGSRHGVRVTRWRTGEADIEPLIATGNLQTVAGAASDREPGLARTPLTITSADVQLERHPPNGLALAYDAAPQACTALLAHQTGLAVSVGPIG